jgi:hypothetical protein
MNTHRTQIIYNHVHPNAQQVIEPSLVLSNTSANEAKPSEQKQSLISYEVQGGVAVLKFTSPPVNALSKAFTAALVGMVYCTTYSQFRKCNPCKPRPQSKGDRTMQRNPKNLHRRCRHLRYGCQTKLWTRRFVLNIVLTL